MSIYLIYLCFSLLSAVLCNELFIIANVLCILFTSQMASRRTQCLVESTKRGFTLSVDPSGEKNRCFYQCLAAHLRMEDVEGLIDMLDNYMLNHRLVAVKNEVRCHVLDLHIIFNYYFYVYFLIFLRKFFSHRHLRRGIILYRHPPRPPP